MVVLVVVYEQGACISRRASRMWQSLWHQDNCGLFNWAESVWVAYQRITYGRGSNFNLLVHHVCFCKLKPFTWNRLLPKSDSTIVSRWDQTVSYTTYYIHISVIFGLISWRSCYKPDSENIPAYENSTCQTSRCLLSMQATILKACLNCESLVDCLFEIELGARLAKAEPIPDWAAGRIDGEAAGPWVVLRLCELFDVEMEGVVYTSKTRTNPSLQPLAIKSYPRTEPFAQEISRTRLPCPVSSIAW
jgi:hypothetical protein